MPEDGQTIGDEFCYRVSDLGFPVSEDAMKMCEKLSKEERKRDQDERSVHIYNDWNGYGMQEILANFVSFAMHLSLVGALKDTANRMPNS